MRGRENEVRKHMSIDDTVALDIGGHGNENPIYVFPEKELSGLSPISIFMCP